jgi:CRP-like cAMP-binding protein
VTRRRRATEPSLGALKAYLQQLAPIDDAEIARFASAHAAEVDYARGAFFTSPGDTHDRVGFVAAGLFRVYYTGADGTYHIRNFCPERTPIGSYATILSGQPAHVSIQAVEDSTVVEFSYQFLREEFDRSASWERLGRRIAEEHYLSRERREEVLLTLDAEGRLAEFEEEFGGLADRLTRADVASYIGVRPETLSRLSRRR